MKTRSTCPDCGVAIGQPHINNCDVERCSVCAGQKITCCCEGHDPQASVWTGEWPGNEDYSQFLAELEEIEADMSASSSSPTMAKTSTGGQQNPSPHAFEWNEEQVRAEVAELMGAEMNGIEANKGSNSVNEAPSDDIRYPEFVPDQRDMELLAHSYLDEAVSLFCFSFFTGNCEERPACLLMNRFEQVAQHLGDSKRREIIDRLDIHRSAKDGDQWQVFKFTCKPGFWNTPANMDAVQRVADSILDDLPPDQDHFGLEFLDTLREVREQKAP